MGHHCIIFLEVDEMQHRDNDISCDQSRMAKIIESLMLEANTLPIIFIRYNPDAFKINTDKCKVSIADRESKLISLIKSLMQPSTSEHPPVSIQYMYYDTDSDAQLSIWKEPEYDQNLLACCLPPII